MVEVGVGHDDHVVFRAAKALHALPVRAAASVDVFGDWRGADEAYGLDHGVVEDRVDGFFVSVHDLQDAFRKARFFHQFGQHERHGWVTLGWFEDKRVAACDGRGEHPHRDHGREVERRDACTNAKRLLHGVHVDAGACAVGEFAFEEFRRADAIFHHFEATLHVACGVWQGFAMLAGQGLGQFVHVVVQEAHEFHHHACATLWIYGGPCWLCGFGGGNGDVHFSGICERHFCLHFARRWVVDV